MKIEKTGIERDRLAEVIDCSSAIDSRRSPGVSGFFSFEGPMAIRLGYDAKLLALVCQRFARRA